jgi:peptide/nickel transport system permease protein
MGMVIVCVLGASLPNLLIAVGITAVPAFTRITRSMVLTIRNQEYIEAAKCIGTPNLKIIITEVIPNSLSPIIVVASSRIGSCTIQAAGLSFLGFGVPAPAPEWGAMISLSRNYIRTAPWMTLFPSLFIIIMVLAFNILGDGLRDALDPKLKR